MGSVPTDFMKTLLCPPAAGREGHAVSASPPSLRHIGEKQPALLLRFLSRLWQCRWLFCLCFMISNTMQAWEVTTMIIDSEPPPSCGTSGKFSSLFSSPHFPGGSLVAMVVPAIPSNSLLLEDWPFQSSLAPLELSSFAPTKWKNSFLKWS